MKDPRGASIILDTRHRDAINYHRDKYGFATFGEAVRDIIERFDRRRKKR